MPVCPSVRQAGRARVEKGYAPVRQCFIKRPSACVAAGCARTACNKDGRGGGEGKRKREAAANRAGKEVILCIMHSMPRTVGMHYLAGRRAPTVSTRGGCIMRFWDAVLFGAQAPQRPPGARQRSEAHRQVSVHGRPGRAQRGLHPVLCCMWGGKPCGAGAQAERPWAWLHGCCASMQAGGRCA